MKALTIHQPWASLIIAGRKRFETRSWRPGREMIGTRIAIHASARPWPRRILLPTMVEAALDLAKLELADLPLGAVLGTAVIGEVVTTRYAVRVPRDFDLTPHNLEFSLGDFSDGRFAWWLRDIEVFAEPVPARGYQKLWEWAPK